MVKKRMTAQVTACDAPTLRPCGLKSGGNLASNFKSRCAIGAAPASSDHHSGTRIVWLAAVRFTFDVQRKTPQLHEATASCRSCRRSPRWQRALCYVRWLDHSRSVSESTVEANEQQTNQQHQLRVAQAPVRHTISEREARFRKMHAHSTLDVFSRNAKI